MISETSTCTCAEADAKFFNYNFRAANCIFPLPALDPFNCLCTRPRCTTPFFDNISNFKFPTSIDQKREDKLWSEKPNGEDDTLIKRQPLVLELHWGTTERALGKHETMAV